MGGRLRLHPLAMARSAVHCRRSLHRSRVQRQWLRFVPRMHMHTGCTPKSNVAAGTQVSSFKWGPLCHSVAQRCTWQKGLPSWDERQGWCQGFSMTHYAGRRSGTCLRRSEACSLHPFTHTIPCTRLLCEQPGLHSCMHHVAARMPLQRSTVNQ